MICYDYKEAKITGLVAGYVQLHCISFRWRNIYFCSSQLFQSLL